MKRYASVWLTDWPITAWRWAEQARRARTALPKPPEAASPEAAPPPFALVERGPRGLTLAALTPEARAVGLKAGQSLADACAMVPHLVSRPHDAQRTARALHRLAGWMERFTPFVALDPQPGGLEGLYLDLTGGQHLFGGEAAMADQILAALGRLGAPARIGVADTPGAAWALARFAKNPAVAAPGGAKEALAALPVAALRLGAEPVKLLNRFGLTAVGSLYGVPRAALARRFQDQAALGVVLRLDQALGRAGEALTPVAAPPLYRVQTVFAEPMTNMEAVAAEAAALAHQLCTALEQDGVGARRLRLTGFRVDGRVTVLEVALALASRRAAHLVRLLADKGWERLDLGFGIDSLALAATVAEPLAARQTSAALGAAGDAQQARDTAHTRAALVDRLSAKLGRGAVLNPRLRESWLPEAAEVLAPFSLDREASPAIVAEGAERPALLFDPPEPMQATAELPDGAPAHFIWRRAPRRVARASGPERLAPEWWRGSPEEGRPEPRTRDYYRIEDEAGGRYWVFREGLYEAAPEGAPPPSWWMHGLFP